MKILILVYCLWTSSLITTSELEEKSCRGPDYVSGICKNLNDCEKLANQAGNESFTEFLELSNTLCEMPMPIICCPDENLTEEFPKVQLKPKPTVDLNFPQVINRLPTFEDNCGVILVRHKKIVGGEPAKLGSYPWMALLGYSKNDGSIAFKCGGSLITSKHVLTAAHCLRDSLKIVRLGELDISTDNETKHIDFEIETAIKHEYDEVFHYGDIGIIYLAQLVEFTPLIRPICLPIMEEINIENYIGHHPFVAGWGQTAEKGISSEKLLELQVEIYEGEVCRNSTRNLSLAPRNVRDTTICAGWLSGGKDSCKGDSGGPLMLPIAYNGEFRFSEIGLVSHGVGCARPDQPAIYTNVISFIDWIRKRVERTK